MDDFLTIPGYLPTKQAAQRIGICEERLLQLARAGRLPFRVIGRNYLFPERAIALFRQQPHGRIRTKPVPWRRYRAGAVVFQRRVEAPIRPGCEQALVSRLCAMAERQEHAFPGTMTRFVSVDDGMLSILLVWKSTELQDEEQLARDVEAFKEGVCDFVAWERGRDRKSVVLAHT